MIKVFYGEDRVRAQEAIQKFLGDDYEVVEGSELTATDLPSLLAGGSLFATERKILIRDALSNGAAMEDLPKYLDTAHKVAMLEMKVDKRSTIYKTLKDKVEFLEFGLAKDKNAGMVFDVYKVAKRDGQKAVAMLEQIRDEQEPMMFLGLMVSQAIRDYAARPGETEKRAQKELSRLDMDLKSSKMQPWTLIEAFLLQLRK